MTCPTCGSGTAQKYRPFCSSRCANLDLGKWMTGSYRLPDDTDPDETNDMNDTPDRPPVKH